MDENVNLNVVKAAVPENTAQHYIDATAQHYIDAMQDMKSRLDNSVPRELYEKAIDDNRLLANAYANGFSIPTGNENEDRRTSKDICKYMIDNKKKLNSIDIVKNCLEYRDAVLFETGIDVFASKGHHVTPSNESLQSAEKTARIYNECIDYSDGNNALFVQEVQRRMVENPAANLINKMR